LPTFELTIFHGRGIDGSNVGNTRQSPLDQVRRRTLIHIDCIDEIRGENREIERPGPGWRRQFATIEIHLSEFGVKTADTDELALPGAALNLHAGDSLQRFRQILFWEFADIFGSNRIDDRNRMALILDGRDQAFTKTSDDDFLKLIGRGISACRRRRIRFSDGGIARCAQAQHGDKQR